MFPEAELTRRLKEAFSDADVTVKDLTGGQNHYEVSIVSEAFAGMLPLKRHRTVYALFDDVMGGDLHALALRTKTPEENG